MSARQAFRVSRARQRGVTLVELMISLLLGLLLTAGIIQVFIGTRVTYATNEGMARIQENARFALDHLSFRARMAGYTGCLSNVPIYNNLAVQDPFIDDIRNGVQGYNANGTGVGVEFPATATNPAPSNNAGEWTPALPAELAGRVIPGSDVLVVRGISSNANSLVPPYSGQGSGGAGQMFINQPHDFLRGQVLVVTDCQKASIFQVTNVQESGLDVNLVHSGSNQYYPGNEHPLLDCGPMQCDYNIGSEVAQLQTFAFYVGQGTNGAPALFQRRLQRLNNETTGFASEELVDNIETMQVRYGVDDDNNGSVDRWITANAVTDWMRVLSVEVSLLARAPEEYGADVDTTVYNVGGTRFDPVDDRRVRQVFSTTIGIRNRLP